MKSKFSIEEWLKFLKIPYSPAGKDELKLACFSCGAPDHLYINTRDNTWICFKGDNQGGGEKNLQQMILERTLSDSMRDVGGHLYFKERGLSSLTISAQMLGYDFANERYTIPYIDSDGPYNIAFRASREDQDPKYLRMPGVPSKAFMVGPRDAQLVIIVEGEIDALSMSQSYPEAFVVGLPGASFINDTLAASIPSGAKLVAIMDDDQPGKTAAKKLRKRFPSIVLGTPGSNCKDVNDLLVRLGPEAVRSRVETLLSNGGDAESEGDVSEAGSNQAKPLRAPAYLRLPDEHGTWLVEDLWVDRSLGFVAGVPKSMKSMLTLHLAHHISTGTPFCGKKVMHPGPVLLVQEEDNDLTIKTRLRGIDGGRGADNLWIWTFGSVGSHVRLDSDDSIEALDEAIREIQPVLVVLDPLANMHMLDNENDAASINKILERLRYIRDLRKTSIMVVHHMRKEGNSQESRHWGQRMRGSSVLHAKSESALYLEKYGDLVRINVETKMAQGRVLELRYRNNGFVWEDEHGPGVET